MKKTLAFLLFACMFSCENDEQVVVLAKHQLKNGSVIVLQKKIGGYLGATTPNVTWINKIETDGKELQIGKIKGSLDEGIISFEPVNDSLLNVRYVDSIWHKTLVYDVNVNQRIYFNDGSPYLEAK